MAVEPREVEDYYRRAAILATVLRRQATDPGGSPSISDPGSVSSSSVSSVSTQSTQSTQSTASVTSQTSQASVSTRSTASVSTPTSSLVITTSDVSSTISSQITTTNSMGQIVTTTYYVVPPTSTNTSSSGGSTNTAAIVGGVVGGVALIVLAALGIFFLRRKMKHDEFEANIFDPDRNVERPTSIGAGPRFDLGGAGGGATALGAGAAGTAAAHDAASHVTPYSYGPTSTHHGSSVAGQPEMSQAGSSAYYPDYNQTNYPQYPVHPVGVGEHFPNPYAPGYHPASLGQAAMAGGAGLGVAAAGGPNRGQTMSSVSSGYPPNSPIYSGTSSDGMSHPGSPPPMAAAVAGSQVPQNPRSAKEREAFARTNPGYAIANPSESARMNPSPTPSANRSSVVGPTSPIVVHQDGGRAPEDDEGGPEEAEIPPTYDSIPRDVAARH